MFSRYLTEQNQSIFYRVVFTDGNKKAFSQSQTNSFRKTEKIGQKANRLPEIYINLKAAELAFMGNELSSNF